MVVESANRRDASQNEAVWSVQIQTALELYVFNAQAITPRSFVLSFMCFAFVPHGLTREAVSVLSYLSPIVPTLFVVCNTYVRRLC